MPTTEAISRVAQLAKSAGVLRPRDLAAHGIARQYLRLAEKSGAVVRSGRGLYTPDNRWAALGGRHQFQQPGFASLGTDRYADFQHSVRRVCAASGRGVRIAISARPGNRAARGVRAL